MPEREPPALPTQEDYRRYDHIWRRVSPDLDPYPEARSLSAPPAPHRLDGAGREEAETLEEFLRDELADARTYRHLAGLAPTAEGRRLMRALAAEETGHMRTLRAAYYLLTGGAYAVTVVLPPQARLPWPERLRERYHAETRAGAAYERAARETPDVSLRELLTRLSRDEYRHAERLRTLLERTL